VTPIGQHECLTAIENAKGWIDSKGIAKILNQHRTVVGASLCRLYKFGEVQRRKTQVSGIKLGYEYKKI